MNEIDSRIARVKQKLAQVQTTGQTHSDEFGVQKHQFRMNSTLSEDTLLAFEARHRIRLPEDYRTFLHTVGNGGAGPYYGILPLEQWASGPDELDNEALSRPCPLSEHLPSTPNWQQMLPAPVGHPYQGTITICHQGGAYYGLLIVSGPAHGRVVYVDLDGQSPYFVREPDFLSWYERWLDETIGGYDLDWFGSRRGGSEADLLLVLRDVHASSSIRSDALDGLTKLPRITNAIPAVLAALQESDAGVRKSAVRVVARFAIAEATPLILRLVTDPDPGMRVNALKALSNLPDIPWPVIQQMLQDSDTDVQEAAWRALNNNQKLTIDDALQMLSSEYRGSRQLAAFSLQSIPGDRALNALLLCLQDPDWFVRLTAIQSLAALRSSKSVSALTELLANEQNADVMQNIINALTEIHDPGAVPALIEATYHSSAGVRYEAARALGVLGDRRAIPALTLLCHDTIQPEEEDQGWPDRICDQAGRSLKNLE